MTAGARSIGRDTCRHLAIRSVPQVTCRSSRPGRRHESFALAADAPGAWFMEAAWPGDGIAVTDSVQKE